MFMIWIHLGYLVFPIMKSAFYIYCHLYIQSHTFISNIFHPQLCILTWLLKLIHSLCYCIIKGVIKEDSCSSCSVVSVARHSSSWKDNRFPRRQRASQAEQTYELLQRKVKGHSGQLLHIRGQSLDSVVDWGSVWVYGNTHSGIFVIVPYPLGGSYFPGYAPTPSWQNPSCRSYCSREDPSLFQLPRKQKTGPLYVL